MKNMTELIYNKQKISETSWMPSYKYFSIIIREKNLRTGAEIGVAFGGHSEAILNQTNVEILYGIDNYEHRVDYEYPMNLPQDDFNDLYEKTNQRLSAFGDRFKLIRADSEIAANQIQGKLDFIYIDADHSYNGVWNDLCSWYSKVRVGGIIGGHDYMHPDFPGVKQAIDEFFRRFYWEIHIEGEGVWWVEKQSLNISFIMPAYNCEKTVQESVESIMDGNFTNGDELVIVNDYSTDNTERILSDLKIKYSAIKIIKHIRNKGGAAARNTAVENTQNPLIFCLDSDNILVPGSIKKLKDFMESSGADVASFQELYYFQNSMDNVTHIGDFNKKIMTLADGLSGGGNTQPTASGNYLFTKESWVRAGGYPEFAGALDTWGFGLRQLVTGSKIFVMSGSYYYHRYGHESYWIRETRKDKNSLIALQIIIPFLNLINEKDIDYIMSRRGRYSWYDNLLKHPIKLKSKNNGDSFKSNVILNISNTLKNYMKIVLFILIKEQIKRLTKRIKLS